MANHEFLEKITLVPGVSGFEKQATRVMKEYLSDCVDEFQYDNLGSLVAIKKGTGDLKVFQIDNQKIGVSQVFTLSSDEILSEKEKYIECMEKIKEAKGYSMIVMYLTDIVRKGSYVLYCENAQEILQEAMEVKEIYQGIYREGILSRKKQIIPKLMKNI